jgi:hypothetical protein
MTFIEYSAGLRTPAATSSFDSVSATGKDCLLLPFLTVLCSLGFSPLVFSFPNQMLIKPRIIFFATSSSHWEK